MRGFWYYLRCKARHNPPLINLEITKSCNARCSFCNYWQLGQGPELEDYSPIIRKFRPVLVSVSGGEPLLRRDYPRVLAGIRPYCHYLSIITNGKLLNEDSARSLTEAGANQICVSLDYLGEQHDRARGVPGLYEHISRTVPTLAQKGYRITLNAVIMESNLDQILAIAHQAKEWGVSISFSAYCSLKRDDRNEMVRKRRHSQLVGIMKEIRRLKRALGVIRNSDYYLDRLPVYFRDGQVPNCKAGSRWLQVTPDGYIQPCSELPRLCHYTEFHRRLLKPPTCAKCWYTCRGESEAWPLEPRRLLELIRS